MSDNKKSCDDELEAWRRMFTENPAPALTEPYVSGTNMRPIGPSDWPADWRERVVYGPDAFKE